MGIVEQRVREEGDLGQFVIEKFFMSENEEWIMNHSDEDNSHRREGIRLEDLIERIENSGRYRNVRVIDHAYDPFGREMVGFVAIVGTPIGTVDQH